GPLSGKAAIILFAVVLPATKSRRASVESRETPRCGQSWIAHWQGTEKVRPGTSPLATTATLDHPHVLSYARYAVCRCLNRNLCIPTYDRLNTTEKMDCERCASWRVVMRRSAKI